MNEKHFIEYAVKSFQRLKENEPTIEPEDGMVWALEELEPGDMTHEEYQQMLDKVIDACVEAGAWTIQQTEPYQFLAYDTLQKKYGDFAACEGFWRPIEPRKLEALLGALQFTPSNFQRDILSAYLTMKQEWQRIEAGEGPGVTVEEAAKALVDDGKVITTPLCAIRKVTDLAKCPKCGCSIPEHTAALSRYDNKTYICASCGTAEALDDYFHEA